jgi:hypothetical protein
MVAPWSLNNRGLLPLGQDLQDGAQAARATCDSNTVPAASNPAVIEIDYDSPSEQDSQVRYTGGVNYRFSNTEYDSATESEWSNG